VTILKEQRLVNAALDSYRSRLNAIPDDEFDLTPPMGGWSYAEVYSHIMQATMGASMMLERCTHGTAKPDSDKGLNFWGLYTMLTSKFPPVKTQTPDGVAGKMPAKKISKEEARNLIVKCHKRMDEMAILINNTPSKRRSRHPRLGMLNSTQWLKFIRVHLQHHLMQLDRIEKNLSK
jgi:hypothetical protein